MEIEMRLRTLILDPTTNTPIVILKEVNGEAVLPIWVGSSEAQAIASEIEKNASPRPFTHDLFKNLLNQLDAYLTRVVVTELKDNTFYAILEIEKNDEKLFLDARPSDAIALALRADCPIFVRDEVLSQSRVSEEVESDEFSSFSDDSDDEEIEWPEELGDLTDYKM